MSRYVLSRFNLVVVSAMLANISLRRPGGENWGDSPGCFAQLFLRARNKYTCQLRTGRAVLFASHTSVE